MGDEHPSGLDETQLWERYRKYPALLAKIVTFGIGGAVAFWVLQSLQGVLVPVLTALIIAYLLDPSVDAFEARRFSRTSAIGILLAGMVLVIAGFFVFLVPSIKLVLVRFVEGLPTLLERLEDAALPMLAPVLGADAPGSLMELATDASESLKSGLPTMAKGALSTAGTVFSQTGSLVSSLLNLVLIPFFTFYFLRDFDLMTAAVTEQIPPRHREWTLDHARRADAVVGAWFRGQIEVAVILGTLYAIGLGICFSWSHIGWTAGVAVGVLAGGLNFIPYVGTSTGVGLAFGLLLLDGASWGVIAGAAVVFGVVQTLEGYVITPRIVGEKVGLSPLAVILALMIGGEVLGLVGLLLALPLAGILGVFLPEMIAAYRSTRLYLGDAEGEA